MKAIFEQVRANPSEVMLVRHINLPVFDAPFHFHPEYELTLIIRGEGQRYVGKQVDPFEDGDLVFLGPNLPHCWLNHPNEGNFFSEAIVVQFTEDFLGSHFFDLNAFQAIKKLMDSSRAGLELYGPEKREISRRFLDLSHAGRSKKVIILLDILDRLSETDKIRPLDPSFAINSFKYAETSRFQKVFSYIIEHYQEPISLSGIAAVADLAPTSFCRYFKNITNQSFVALLLDFRIKQSCHLLLSTDLPIKEIAFQIGFEDIPYFNRVFRKKKGVSPQSYRNRHGNLPRMANSPNVQILA